MRGSSSQSVGPWTPFKAYSVKTIFIICSYVHILSFFTSHSLSSVQVYGIIFQKLHDM